MVELVNRLPPGKHHFQHPHDVRVVAVLEQHDLTQDATRFREGLEEVDDLLDGDVCTIGFARGLGDVTVTALPDDLLHFVLVVEVLHGEDFVYIVCDWLATHHLLLRLHNYYTTNSASPK